MSPYHMQIEKNPHQRSERVSQAQAQQDEISPVSILTKLKEQLREQICDHPGEALKISLLAGLFAGWWVKR